jgi:hypothetical protein
MDSSSKESASSYDNCLGSKASSLESFDTNHPCLILGKDQPSNRALNGLQVWVLFEERSCRSSVESPIALCTWRPYCRTLAPVEHPELKHGEIRSSPHYSAKRIHLAHDGSFRDSAYRRVARHLADGLERARDETYPGIQASGCDCGFSSGVTSSDDDYIELGLEIL